MRNLILILIVFIAVVTFIRAFDYNEFRQPQTAQNTEHNSRY